MQLITTKNYNKQLKKLTRYPKSEEYLKKIKEFLTNAENFKSILNNPIALMYGFERLRNNLNSFYSFNLNKHGGVIRLIIIPKDDTSLCLVFISFKHYEDFDPTNIEYDE